MEFVRRIHFVWEPEHGVFEGQQRSRIDVELNVKVNRTPTPVFRMKIHLPGLTQGIGLDEVTFIVNVESVSNRVVLQVCDETSNINGGHYPSG